MKLISLDLQKMVVAKQTETKAYTDGIAKLKNMSVEYDRLSKASGASMMKTRTVIYRDGLPDDPTKMQKIMNI
jgi:hypothetical protein